MRAVWLVLFAVAACKGEKKKEEARSSPPVPEEPAPRAAPVAKAPDPGPRPTGLPENGPHPDYPTAAAAGTDKIFFLEDPDRGPKAPVSFARPTDLVWTRAPYCETYEKTWVCGPGTGDWYVGRKKGITIVEKRRGALIDQSTVYVTSEGKIAQQLTVDHAGQVIHALLFTQPGRYTGRERGGGNALDGCGMMSYVEDKQGRVIESRCLQWLGELMRDTSGVAIRKYVLDQRGLNREWTYHGTDGAPVDNTDGVHRVVVTRDSAGRIVLLQQFSKFGVRIIDADGCAGTKYEYDAAGHLTGTTCLDTVDKPVANHDGVAITSYRFDADGCSTARRYFDAKGANAATSFGVHGRDYAMTDHCKISVETCLGVDERSHACSPGQPARRSFTRDARGRVISTKHFDASGAPATSGSYDVFELRYAFDDADHVIAMNCFDKDGAPVECGSTGFHGWREEYDDAGREVAQTFVSKTGGPATNMGTTRRVFRYDNYDHEVESRDLDGDGKPIEMRGMAIRRNLWDSTHRLFAVLLYRIDNTPAPYDGCYTGSTCPGKPWHAVRINRRVDGTALTNQFFDEAGQPVGTIDCLAKPCFDRD